MLSGALGILVTIALAVIAISAATIAGVAVRVALKLERQTRALTETLEWLSRDGPPALTAARGAAEQLQALTGAVMQEAQELTSLTGDLRTRLRNAADAMEERFEDVASLFDVVFGEVEETALDIAAGFRTVRRGRSVLGRMRRALLGRR